MSLIETLDIRCIVYTALYIYFHYTMYKTQQNWFYVSHIPIILIKVPDKDNTHAGLTKLSIVGFLRYFPVSKI